MKYTENDLWAFVWRAQTFEEIRIAEAWLKAHVTDNDLFDDLMCALADQHRSLSRGLCREY